MELTLPHEWSPRTYQLRIWDALTSGCKRAIWIVHRRAGKDWTALHWTATATMARVGLYWHMLPQYSQARKVVWNNTTNDGRSYRSVFPGYDQPNVFKDKPCMVVNSNEHEMRLKLINDSIWQLVGSDKPDSLRGPNPVGIVYSEWAFMNPAARDIVQPILDANGGWELYITTPNGKNHAWRTLEEAKSNEWHPIENPNGWFWEVLTIEDTKDERGLPIITEQQIEYHRKQGKPEEWIAREFYCSFNTSVEGSFYGRQMTECEKEGRIGVVPWDTRFVVHTAWDLGYADMTVIWFYQVIDNKVFIIDLYSNNYQSIEHYGKIVKERPYLYGDHFVPHDAAQGEQGTGKRKIDMLKQYGIRAKVLPKLPISDGINAVRATLPRCFFDKKKCEKGVQALREYHKKKLEGQFDENGLQMYSDEPDHDNASHWADAFRYLCLSLKTPKSEVRNFKHGQAIQKFSYFT